MSKENRYLDMGYDKYMKISGDEEEAADLQTNNLIYPTGEVLQADIANLGIPVFMQRIRTWGEKEDNTNYLRLVDLWFKEVDGKTLTFSMYYASGYSYMMNIMLLEGGEAKPIEAWLLLPKKEFVLTEGEVFSTAG